MLCLGMSWQTVTSCLSVKSYMELYRTTQLPPGLRKNFSTLRLEAEAKISTACSAFLDRVNPSEEAEPVKFWTICTEKALEL